MTTATNRETFISAWDSHISELTKLAWSDIDSLPRIKGLQAELRELLSAIADKTYPAAEEDAA